jgi:hypothetical protein
LPEWIEQGEEGIENRKIFTTVLSARGVRGREHGYVTNTLYH